MAIRLEEVFPGCTPEEYKKLERMDLPLFEVTGHREITPEEGIEEMNERVAELFE